MAARIIGPTLARHNQIGLDMLTPEEGLELFDKALRGGRAFNVAAALDQAGTTSELPRRARRHTAIVPFAAGLG